MADDEYRQGANSYPQVQPYPGLRTPWLQQVAFRLPSLLQALPGLPQTVPGTRDENLLQPGEEGAVVGSRPVPGTADRQPRFRGVAPYNLPGVEDDRVQPTGAPQALRPSPLLQYIGDLLGFGKGQTGAPLTSGYTGELLKRLTPQRYGGYDYLTQPWSALRMTPGRVPQVPSNDNPSE